MYFITTLFFFVCISSTVFSCKFDPIHGFSLDFACCRWYMLVLFMSLLIGQMLPLFKGSPCWNGKEWKFSSWCKLMRHPTGFLPIWQLCDGGVEGILAQSCVSALPSHPLYHPFTYIMLSQVNMRENDKYLTVRYKVIIQTHNSADAHKPLSGLSTRGEMFRVAFMNSKSDTACKAI